MLEQRLILLIAFPAIRRTLAEKANLSHKTTPNHVTTHIPELDTSLLWSCEPSTCGQIKLTTHFRPTAEVDTPKHEYFQFIKVWLTRPYFAH